MDSQSQEACDRLIQPEMMVRNLFDSLTPSSESGVSPKSAKNAEARVPEEQSRQRVEEQGEFQRGNEDFQRDLSARQKVEPQIEAEIGRLRQHIDPEASGDPGCDEKEPSVRHLPRENRRMQGTFEKFDKRLEGRPGSGPTHGHLLESLGETLAEMKQLVLREIIDNGRERNEVRKTMEELRSELRNLRTEFQGSLDRDRKTVRAPGDAERVGIFVDVQNIFYAAKQFNARLDFEKLMRTATDGRRLIRAIAYVVQSPEVDQSGFIAMLQQKSYEVKRKNLRLRSDGSAKGDWDMGMAIDIIGLAEKLDVVVLVSGDGDFVSLVNLIKTIGPRVEVFSFVHNTARDLAQAADAHVPIEESLLLRLNGETTSFRQGREAGAAARNVDGGSPPETGRMTEAGRQPAPVRSPEPAEALEGTA